MTTGKEELSISHFNFSCSVLHLRVDKHPTVDNSGGAALSGSSNSSGAA